MKKSLFVLLIILCGFETGFTQNTKFYGSGGSEMIFSFATIDNNGNTQGDVMRWSPVLNLQAFANLDIANTIGFFTGLGCRNVGFIYNVPDTNITMKYRTYNLGIPIGLKIGKLDFMFIFAGYEIEFPFNYKEKKFENDHKDKYVAWFTNRVEPVQHTLMAGVQFPYGLDLKFKYYLTNFHNMNYVDGNGEKPYENLKSNIFYFSLSWDLFTNMKKYNKKDNLQTVMR